MRVVERDRVLGLLPTALAVVALLAAMTVVEIGWRDPSPGRAVAVPAPARIEPALERLRGVPLQQIDDPGAAAVASGVVFGRTEQVSSQDEAAFLESGLWHLLAASGQNIALVAGVCVVLARTFGAGRTTGAVLALAAVPAYVAVVGGGASIVRAGLMGELLLVAWLVGRIADVRHLLVVAAALICWIWPGAHRGLGMQLSFACVAALAWWAVPATRWLEERGVHRWIAGGLVASLLCSAATAPILVVRTGAAPVLGVLANVVAVPLAGCILVIGLAGVAVALLADAVGAPALGHVAMLPPGLLARALLDIAHRAAAWPLAQTDSRALAVGLPLLWWLACASPLGRRRWARRGAVAAAALLIGWGALAALPVRTPLAALTSGAPPPVSAEQLRVGVLDIGQGDATLLATEGHAVLVDTGPPDGQVVRRVRELGVDRLDGIVLTHDSLDHRGGFEEALARLRPRWVAMPRGALGSWRRVRDLAPRLVELCAGASFDVGRARVDVLHPRCDGVIVPRTGDLHNDGAMVLLVSHGDIRALLPADAEAPVLVGLDLPPLDLLRVSHHGSADDALDRLLQRTAPQVAAISVGAGNSYGHPTPSTLAALRAARVTTLRTDRDGSVVLDSDGRRLRLVG